MSTPISLAVLVPIAALANFIQNVRALSGARGFDDSLEGVFSLKGRAHWFTNGTVESPQQERFLRAICEQLTCLVLRVELEPGETWP